MDEAGKRSLEEVVQTLNVVGVYDGTVYTHAMYGSGDDKTVTWSNPNRLKHPHHMTVIRGYVELAEAADLKRLL